MRIDQLKTALKVAELKSFSGAGEALYLAQVTVSQQVAALEREIGFRLFDRKRWYHHGTGVTVTEKGATFLLFASKAVRLLEQGIVEAVEKG